MKSHAKPPPDICGGLTRGAMVEVVVFTAAALAVAGTLALGAGTCLASVLGVALDLEQVMRAFDM